MEANNCHNPFCRHCKEVVFTKHLIPLITTLWERKFDEHGFVQGYTRTAKEIISAGKGGCSWCYELTSSLRELEDYRRDEPKFFLGKRGRKESDITLRIELHFSFLMTSQNGQVGVLVHAGNDSVKLKAYLFNITKPYAEHPIFPVLENGIYFGSEECFRGIKSFTRQCDAQHGLMRSQALRGERRRQELPARVVDVKADTLRIVEVDTIVPEDLVYGALSYCWGTEQQYVLTTETLEQKRITLSSKRIPAAISDAIEVTRKVGLKYLWIDALCIVQDDDADRNSEIAKMKNIYQHARLTIAASNAASAHDHFLITSECYPDYWKPRPIKPKLGDQGLQIVLTRPWYNMLHEPLNNRAWALQEHVMSDHLLSFSHEGIEMSCKHMFSTRRPPDDQLDFKATLNAQTRLLAGVTTGPRWLAESSNDDPRIFWWNLRRVYSTRKMKRASDKLIAISALAELMSTQLGRYIAGLWERDLLNELHWHGSVPNPQPEIYRAPSWSWASCDGSIHHAGDNVENYRNARIDAYSVTLLDPNNPFGAVTDGYLKLTCVSATAILTTDRRGFIYGNVQGPRDAKRFLPRIVLHTTLDKGEHLQVTFAAIGIKNTTVRGMHRADVQGLVLQPASPDEWRRIGSFEECHPLAFSYSYENSFMII